MITSIGSSNETLAQILDKLNSINTDGSKGISKKELNALNEETDFTKTLMECFDSIDNDKDGELTTDEVSEKSTLLGQMGVPAGLQIEDASESFMDKIGDFLKGKFDLNKDGSLSKADLKVAEEKSPLVKSLVDSFENLKSGNGDGNLASYFQNIFSQYKDTPLNAVKDVAQIFA